MKPSIKYLPFVIALLLALVPLLWLKPGQIDIGGDSSRLYFYDPINYLRSFPLYAIGPTGIGSNLASYFLIPYTFAALLFRQLLGSSHLLIIAFDGLNLVVAFLSVFYIIVSLLRIDFKEKNQVTNIYLAACIASLFYTLSPLLTPNGWDKAMYAHNQYFINPFFFFLFLRFVQTKRIFYLLVGILASFVFAPNFTATPYFFSFFPLAVLYIVIYALLVRRTGLEIKPIITVIVLFILTHAFHVVPLILNVFTPSNYLNTGIFSNEGKLVRGLSYFLDVARSIRLPNNLLTIVQGDRNILSSFWIVFPITIVIGAIQNQKIQKIQQKAGSNFLLLFTILLLLTFFITANITSIGFSLYKELFNVPGFAMFRNYLGQFSHVFVFYYALVLGYSIYYILFLNVINKSYLKKIFVFGLMVIIVLTAVPFIRGDMINHLLNPGGNPKLRVPLIMDPSYEDMLGYIRNIPKDAKTINLPLTEGGVHMVTGKDGGAYQGPSMISYLTGKVDFTGYDGFHPFGNQLFVAVEKKDYKTISSLLSVLNVGYIVFNADPLIYGKAFPNYPYGSTHQIIATEKKAYENLITNIPHENGLAFSEKYLIYPLPSDAFLPHVYTPEKIFGSDDNANLLPILNMEGTLRSGIFNNEENLPFNAIYIEAKPEGFYGELRNNYHLHIHSPFVAQKPGSVRYPLVIFKEQYDLEKQKSTPDAYVDLALNQSSKRVAELERWREEIGISHKAFVSNSLYVSPEQYNSWESELFHYSKAMNAVIDYVANAELPDTLKDVKETLIFEQLSQHEIKLLEVVSGLPASDFDRKYLANLVTQHVQQLRSRISPRSLDPQRLLYTLPPLTEKGLYKVRLVNEPGISSIPTIFLNDKTLIPFEKNDGTYLSFGPVSLDEKKDYVISSQIDIENLADRYSEWSNSGSVIASEDGERLLLRNTVGKNAGLVKEIKDAQPNTQYLVSFDFNTGGKPVEYALLEKISQNGKVVTDLRSRKILRSNNWKGNQMLFTTSNDANAILLQFSNAQSSVQELSIRNVSVIRVSVPKIFLVKENDAKSFVNPSIIFTKKNPTKYVVDVKDAHGPFVLIFSDGFDASWKAYPMIGDASGLRSGLGDILASIVALFQKKTDSDRIVANYFDGKVREKEHKNTFLEPNTFETWGRKSINEKNHLIANTYANAWIIHPGDVNNEKDFALVLEYEPQRTFYPLFFLSILTVIATCLYCIYAYIYKK